MHWLGEKKETSIKQIEFKSFGRAGSQQASPGNGFGLHWDSRGPSLQFANQAGGLGGLGTARGRHPPTSHPHPSTLDPCVAPFVFLTHQRDPKALAGSRSFQPTPAQTPRTLEPLQNSVSPSPSFGSFQPLGPLGPSQNASSGSAWPWWCQWSNSLAVQEW